MAGSILKRFFRDLLKSIIFIKRPRCNRVCEKTQALRTIRLRPIQELFDRCPQTFAMMLFGGKSNKLQIAFPEDILISFLQLTKKGIKLFLECG